MSTNTQTSRPRIGPAMHIVYEYVLKNPGTAKLGAARYATPRSVPSSSTNPLRHGYRSVDRAIAAGIITAQLHGRTYKLYANPARYEELTRDEATECDIYGCPCDRGGPCVMEHGYPEPSDGATK